MFASMNYEKLLKNPRDSFLIAEGHTLSPTTQGHPTTIFGKYLFGRRFEI